MGDDDHRHAVRRQLFHNLQNLADHLRVQRRGRLVKQHDVGVHRQRTGDRHTLLLAAGKLCRVGFGLFGQPHAIQQVQRTLLGLGFRCLFQFHRGQHHIAHDVQVVEQVEVLEHHTDVLTHFIQVSLFVGQVVAVHDDLTSGDLFQPVQAAQKGGLTAAGGTEDDDDLTLINIGRDIFQHFQFAEVFLQMLNVNFNIVFIDAHG